ncbi:hypothetical protein [Endozoicomonas sp. GU-1]|uniref:hypothetical protein n=1 Tax=Endozoicomonas sp. GU-1 TaxID=3009078 RepID=UPI0022B4F532|nr:hypothetical protein [Endozoicomonas sp. GU-1]WBA81361.1 hypothetical protein O2T12_24290 [Endozoicomonas sp. GU-1]WBA84309.1 hypothetical protein O3276_13460 [Endozoicomonas sp. GU-1]
MSRLITRQNLHDFVSGGCLILGKGMLLSPGAADLAKIQGIQVIRNPESSAVEVLQQRIQMLLVDEFNITSPEQIESIQQEVIRHLFK